MKYTLAYMIFLILGVRLFLIFININNIPFSLINFLLYLGFYFSWSLTGIFIRMVVED